MACPICTKNVTREEILNVYPRWSKHWPEMYHKDKPKQLQCRCSHAKRVLKLETFHDKPIFALKYDSQKKWQTFACHGGAIHCAECGKDKKCPIKSCGKSEYQAVY